jgi:hypothetical protein
LSEGWLGPRDTPASVEDAAQHFDAIQSSEKLVFPQHLVDEFSQLIKAIERNASRWFWACVTRPSAPRWLK